MASSISSEQAFSSAGITISRCHNQLKPDVVEALQFLKCIYHRDLLFQDDLHAETEVEELEGGGHEGVNPSSAEEGGWDVLIEDLR